MLVRPYAETPPRGFPTLLRPEGGLQTWFSAHHGEGERGSIEIERQLAPGRRVQGETRVTRENHDREPLPWQNDLIVGLNREGHGVEATGHQRLTLRHGDVVTLTGERLVILRVGPAARDDTDLSLAPDARRVVGQHHEI